MNYEQSNSVDIDASAENVWATWIDVPEWPGWIDTTASARWVGATGMEIGHRVRLRQQRYMAPTVWTVTAVEPGRSFTWSTRSPGMAYTATHVIVPREGGVTATLSTAITGFFAPILGAVTLNIGRRYVVTATEGLKRRCEGATCQE